MHAEDVAIHHVSDTALWVAYYRAMEGESPSALFRDPLAKRLAGERGKRIAESMGATARYTRWSVVIRTCIIDDYIRELVAAGVDTVVNVGAGLDTRPYRLELPPTLRWVEIDFPEVLEHKEKVLGEERSGVRLERIALDLADRDRRRERFATIGAQSGKALVLTEGVIPYLTEPQVETLAEDLHSQPSFHFWIAEYFSPRIYRYFRTKERARQLRNAPFRFFPASWFDVFARHGWKPRETRYLGEASRERNRPMPLPWWARLLVSLSGRKRATEHERQMGYVLFARESTQ